MDTGSAVHFSDLRRGFVAFCSYGAPLRMAPLLAMDCVLSRGAGRNPRCDDPA